MTTTVGLHCDNDEYAIELDTLASLISASIAGIDTQITAVTDMNGVDWDTLDCDELITRLQEYHRLRSFRDKAEDLNNWLSSQPPF